MAKDNMMASSPVQGPLRRRKQLERDIEHITAEMYRRNRELAETNQTLSLVQTVNSLALNSQESLAKVCGEIASTIAESAGFPLVATLITEDGTLDDLVVYGVNEALGKQLKLFLGTHKHLRLAFEPASWPEGTRSQVFALKSWTPQIIARFLGGKQDVVKAVLKQLGLQSLYVIKLTAHERLVGFLVTGFYAFADQMAEADIRLLDQLGEPVGIALENRLLFEENQHVAAQLRRTNAKLKQLDETKDEFITMASHQLRTPLTSVKGYLSMVLDGDAGKLTKQQTELLNQSYVSAQRMVYLISDLLNLSRLNTGKFVIEPIPIDLNEIVQSEINQLRETAKARGVTVEFKHPTKVSALLLDETKTHQVVMNFMDNAIYYTPAGGKITVSVTETPSAVEYTVKDNGIGVPKAEQHKLFTKFYRAGNARQARPDGTGLGLFMAKKVIVAQGGSIIFQSTEGKGSTFGFRFSKAQHLAPSGLPPVKPKA